MGAMREKSTDSVTFSEDVKVSEMKPAPPSVIDGFAVPLGEDGVPITASFYNLPDSGEWFINRRGQRHHTRSFLPARPKDLKGIVFYHHGYGAHVSSPSPCKYARALTAKGLAVFMLDYAGHGRSEGERAFIDDYVHWIDDAVEFVRIVAARGCEHEEEGKASFSLGSNSEEWKAALRTAKVAISGQSLGGAISLMVGKRLEDDAIISKERFVGAALMCPFVKGTYPPAPVLYLLRHVIAPLVPLRQVPSFLEKANKPDIMWTDESTKIRAKLDRWGLEGGLGWGDNMRFGTAAQFLNLIEAMETHLSMVDFPFVVMHDPEDGIVPFDGTRMLLQFATTPTSIPRGREVHEMHGGLHDLLSNRAPEVADITADWVLARIHSM